MNFCSFKSFFDNLDRYLYFLNLKIIYFKKFKNKSYKRVKLSKVLIITNLLLVAVDIVVSSASRYFEEQLKTEEEWYLFFPVRIAEPLCWLLQRRLLGTVQYLVPPNILRITLIIFCYKRKMFLEIKICILNLKNEIQKKIPIIWTNIFRA